MVTMYETKKFLLRPQGLSRDQRTNVWKVTCKKCKKLFTPVTTMFSSQMIECKCGETEEVNYNKLTNNE